MPSEGPLEQNSTRKKYTERKSDFSYASIICPEQLGTQNKAPSVL